MKMKVSKPEVKQVEYINKRGQVVQVWQWTLDKKTTVYPEKSAPTYMRASRKG